MKLQPLLLSFLIVMPADPEISASPAVDVDGPKIMRMADGENKEGLQTSPRHHCGLKGAALDRQSRLFSSQSHSVETFHFRFATGVFLGYRYPAGDKSYLYADDSGYRDSSEVIQFREMMVLDYAVSAIYKRVSYQLFLHIALGIEYGGAFGFGWHLFDSSPISPYFGTNLGVDYIEDGEDESRSRKRHSGPSVAPKAGILFLQHEPIHIVVEADYKVVFNSSYDQSFGFRIGLFYCDANR